MNSYGSPLEIIASCGIPCLEVRDDDDVGDSGDGEQRQQRQRRGRGHRADEGRGGGLLCGKLAPYVVILAAIWSLCCSVYIVGTPSLVRIIGPPGYQDSGPVANVAEFWRFFLCTLEVSKYLRMGVSGIKSKDSLNK